MLAVPKRKNRWLKVLVTCVQICRTFDQAVRLSG
jgi:hypothetical protein